MEGERAPILVVDDDAAIVEFLQMALEDNDYDVMTAPHGAAALEIVRQRSPGLILLDARMTVMDGKEFAQAYRATPGEHAPIVVLTAVRDVEQEAAAIGCDAYLGKPFELAALLDVVKHYLR
jgi:DNA-binding response OmpR family regulator